MKAQNAKVGLKFTVEVEVGFAEFEQLLSFIMTDKSFMPTVKDSPDLGPDMKALSIEDVGRYIQNITQAVCTETLRTATLVNSMPKGRPNGR